MEYKVVPINPIQREKETEVHVAQEFEAMIKKYNAEGWEYLRTESLKIWVNGDNGCFGFGGKPGYYSEKQMVVFKK